MPRTKRALNPNQNGAGFYHVINRTVAGEFLFQDAEKEEFTRLMRKTAAYCGIKILTHVVMSNHYHILIEVPVRKPLSEEDMLRILTEPKNSLIRQYSKLLSLDGVELQVTRDGLQAIAAAAIKRGTGARALRSIFEELMLDIMFEMPGREDVKTVIINRAVVEEGKAPGIKKAKRKSQDAA